MTIAISKKTIFLSVFLIILLIFLWQLRTLVLSLILSYILVSGFRPLVKKTQRGFHLSYKVSAFLTFFVCFGLFFTLLGLFFSPFISQFQLFVANFPAILGEVLARAQSLGVNVSAEQLQKTLSPVLNQGIGSLINLTLSSISGFLFFVGVFVVTFYLLLEHDETLDFLASFFPGKEEKLKALEAEIERRIGGWVLGQILIAGLVGITTFAGLTVLGVNYSLTLTMIATFLSPIAGLGPLLALIPALVISAVQNPILAVWIFLFYNIIQTLKDNFLVPKVMSGIIGLNAFMILFVLLIGTVLFGFLGAVVSVPAAVGIGVIVEEIMKTKQTKK
ncbi:MAG: AI-2E family transporter [bacterium]|nr:AI-2E family transporter [bacterium]